MGEVYAHTPTYLPLVDKGDTASPLLVLVTSVASFNCLPMMAAPVGIEPTISAFMVGILGIEPRT